MSFDALSTELDKCILSFLDHDELNTMSKVSKSYREVTEPFLYRHIQLFNYKHANIRWLVVTLLHRPALAPHIRTLNLSEKDSRTEDHALNERMIHDPAQFLDSYILKLVNIISDAFGPGPEVAKDRLSWLGAIVTDEYVEGSFALIAYLASNLESLTLAYNVGPNESSVWHGELLSSIIWQTFIRSHERLDTSIHAFSKLQSLNLTTRAWVQVNTLPNLRALRINASEKLSVPHLFPMRACHELRTLEMLFTAGSLIRIKQIFSDGRLSKLRRLVLHQFLSYPDRSWQPIIDAIVDNCHQLEYLQLTSLEDCRFDNETESLRDLTGLTNLKTLYIDIDLLVDYNDRGALLRLNELIPSSLEALTIYGINIWELIDLARPFLQATSLDQPIWKRAYKLASLCSLNDLSLVSEFDELDGAERRQMRSLLLHLSTSLWTRSHTEFRSYQPRHSEMEAECI